MKLPNGKLYGFGKVHNDGRIYPTEKEFVISDGGGWLPGVYISEEAARLALDMGYCDLIRFFVQNDLKDVVTLEQLTKFNLERSRAKTL